MSVQECLLVPQLCSWLVTPLLMVVVVVRTWGSCVWKWLEFLQRPEVSIRCLSQLLSTVFCVTGSLSGLRALSLATLSRQWVPRRSTHLYLPVLVLEACVTQLNFSRIGNLNPGPLLCIKHLIAWAMSEVPILCFQDNLLKYNSHNTNFTPLSLL